MQVEGHRGVCPNTALWLLAVSSFGGGGGGISELCNEQGGGTTDGSCVYD